MIKLHLNHWYEEYTNDESEVTLCNQHYGEQVSELLRQECESRFHPMLIFSNAIPDVIPSFSDTFTRN